ncbi:hypothetical protein [Pseudomonas sp. JUb96]|uniref:hypothetical protein n=1 Tax=Pseudomonas sp. JUb96 TaxID=2940539 RepID=UPI002226B28A|nr:hypothetical protein [Pseudomonas sp. JUb96]MCW2270994.1 hypothetical protein [Pseudomonas sp. JUb96]
MSKKLKSSLLVLSAFLRAKENPADVNLRGFQKGKPSMPSIPTIHLGSWEMSLIRPATYSRPQTT